MYCCTKGLDPSTGAVHSAGGGHPGDGGRRRRER
ncbi:hypothetical protein OROGR_026961 [Orobanche gracilis]